jgi:hypothetical protein
METALESLSVYGKKMYFVVNITVRPYPITSPPKKGFFVEIIYLYTRVSFSPSDGPFHPAERDPANAKGKSQL